MILENGVVRTLDPSLPTARALAIAGAHVAGGVGTHESALPSPDVVDLGGRCVLPGLHGLARPLPDLVALAARGEARRFIEPRGRAGARSPPSPARQLDPWLRLEIGRVGRAAHRGRARRDHGRDPGAPLLEGLPLGMAQLRRARAGRGRAGGRRRGRRARLGRSEPTGILREESAWQFRARAAMPSEDEFVEATREGLRIAASRGVVAIHDKDGWLGAPGIFQRVHERDELTLRVWGSLPYERLPELDALGIHSGIGDDFLRIGYLKAFMDGTLGSQTAWMLDGSGVVDHERRAARRGHPARAHGSAGRWAYTRSATGRTARRSTPSSQTRDAWEPLGLRHRIEHAQCLAPEDVGRFAELGVACSVQFSHAPSDRDLAERFWPDQVDGAYAFRSLLESGALVANGSDAPVEELDPLAGISAGVLRTIDERPAWHPEQCLTVEEALVATLRQPGMALARRTAARQAPPGLPRRPRRALPRSARVPAGRARTRSRSSRRWSAAAGCTTARPGTDAAGRHRSRGGPAVLRLRPGGVRPRSAGPSGARLRDPRRAVRVPSGHERARDRPGHRPGDAASPRPRRGPLRRDRAERRPRALPGARPRRPRGHPRDIARGRRAARVVVRPGRSGVLVPLGRRARGSRERSGAHWVPTAASRSGGRSSAREQARTHFIRATSPLLEGLDSSPTKGEPGRPPHALDAEARIGALVATGFADVFHEVVRWDATWDTEGIRALYGTFSPILRLEPARRKDILDEIARIAAQQFGGRVSRTLTTSLYTARKPS